MKKIKSGVCGLDRLLYGGLNERTVTVVIGASGTGKTTFSISFIKKGLESGQPGIFISLDENKEQIIRDAIEMGLYDIQDYLDEKKLIFIDASGKQFTDFINQELPNFINRWEGVNTRIAIDPLTPVIWAVENRYNQRQILTTLFKETTKIGTVLCTLEEHGTLGDLSGSETVIPMYLADSIIHLKHTNEAQMLGKLKIIKCRGSKHSKFSHPYKILRGFGIVLQGVTAPKKITKKIPNQLKNILQKSRLSPTAYQKISFLLDELDDNDFEGIDMEQIISDILHLYEE
jgi:KaiC/GvpD/RAD55 family RecA-like ATPase